MRWQFWHTPTRIVSHASRHIIRIIDGWPTTNGILAAYHRIELPIRAHQHSPEESGLEHGPSKPRRARLEHGQVAG